MKNIKNKIFLSILAICGILLVGMTTVNAATYNTFVLKNSDIVCDPAKLEKGGRSVCYLIGKPEGTDDSPAVHGYVMNAYTTKYLTLVNTQKVVMTNTNTVFSKETSSTETIPKSADMPESLTKFSCQRDTSIESNQNITSYGCGIFYTVATAQNKAFTPESIRNADINETLLRDTTYGAVGAFVVELSSDVQGSECGEICVKAWRVPEADMYTNYTCTDLGCGVDTVEQKYDCKEINYTASSFTEPEPTETGAFASYALLAAGALIAISAVALAKKNNKFSRI